MMEPGSRRAVPFAFGAGSGCPGASAGRHLCGGTGERNAGRRGPGGRGLGGFEGEGPQAVTFKGGLQKRGGHSAPQNLIRASLELIKVGVQGCSPNYYPKP